MNSHNKQSKNEKFWKTALKITLKAQNTRFSRLEWAANKSPIQVTKSSFDKFWNICLSVFLQLEGPLVSKSRNSLSKLTTGASTHETVTKQSRENPKNPKFLNFSKFFFVTGALTCNRVAKSFCVSSWLGARDLLDSRGRVAKTGLHSSWKFSRQKHFSKTIKTLKILFVFDQHIIEHVQHI